MYTRIGNTLVLVYSYMDISALFMNECICYSMLAYVHVHVCVKVRMNSMKMANGFNDPIISVQYIDGT